jgi:hypothetical protein
VRFDIDLSAEGFEDAFLKMQSYAQESLADALEAAALDPFQLPPVPGMSPNARMLGFASGNGLCLLRVNEETRTITVRIIRAPL